ncbi:alginate lyase family protein [Paraburkholderia susongensis]|uniref:Alginate lyase n=1 Tax=Paraburkholderia susongensis TaxID=1515439 RepID=A0A1X7LM46_9BURK|nr:alginate lyase family protein [Paraburkholderia susongensis]SMG54393.1 Alginate lyase [Paraburkholderia susongensis]
MLQRIIRLKIPLCCAALLMLGACGGESSMTSGNTASTSSDTAGTSPTTPPEVHAAFKHPGILTTKARLDYVKAQIAANNLLFVNEFNKLKSSQSASASYKVAGTLTDGNISCGAVSSVDHGCNAEKADAAAAYAQALMWYFTGDETYAKNAVSILNFYANNLTAGHSGFNGPLEAAWNAEVFPAAAEIIRYTYSGWSEPEAKAFETMLKTQYLPDINGVNGYGTEGNWKLSMIDGMIDIAVFTNDRALFDDAVAQWKKWIPAYYYNASLDGNAPVTFPGSPSGDSPTNTCGPDCRQATLSLWNGQTVFDSLVSGVTQETCRDLGHAQYGIGATFNAAETAYIQGKDLYAAEASRLTTALEFNAKLLNGSADHQNNDLVTAPGDLFGSLCSSGTPPNEFQYNTKPTMMRAYNAYAKRKGMVLPETSTYIVNEVIPFKNPTDHEIQWEVLTDGDSPSEPID